jgi:hypothetical protein
VLSASPRSDARYSRKLRSAGVLLRVSVIDRELDEWAWGMGYPGRHPVHTTHPAFNEQFKIDGAHPVSVEAETVSIIQVFNAELFRTTLVGPIQERAMMSFVGHARSGESTLVPREISAKGCGLRESRNPQLSGVGVIDGFVGWLGP